MACGWTRVELAEHRLWAPAGVKGMEAINHVMPDYLNDLNACHDAEKVLTDEQGSEYSEALERVVGGRFNSNNSEDMRRLRSATAAQRCEAFLRTIGKWKETSP